MVCVFLSVHLKGVSFAEECRLKVLWAITYIITVHHYLFHFILYKSIATSWTCIYASHPSIYSITLFIQTI